MITRVSRYGQELTGRSLEQIAGTPAESHPEKWEIHYPDGRSFPRTICR